MRAYVFQFLGCVVGCVLAFHAEPAVAAMQGSDDAADLGVTNMGVHGAIRFDIGAVSLPSALDAYSQSSGIQVLYDGALASGRLSAPVHDVTTAENALTRLLEGTGLAAVFTRDRNVIIVLNPGASKVVYTVLPPGPVMRLGMLHVDAPKLIGSGGTYASLVQSELQRVLLRNPRLLVGHYEALVRIWVDQGGIVQKSQLVSSTGNTHCDGALLKTIQSLAVSAPPPIDLVQPVSIRVAVSGP
jgi:TonB family protein